MESGLSAPSLMAVKSWWSCYWSTNLKLLLSVVQRMGFVMSFPKILVIPFVIPSLTWIALRRKTLFRSASPYLLMLIAISGSTLLSSVLARSAAALDAASTSLFLM